jgi:hypothetical protein
MAKIFISYPEELKPLADVISNSLRKNSGHRPALYQEQSDFTLELAQDWAGGNNNPTFFIFEDNHILQSIGKNTVELFQAEGISAEYPKKKNETKNFPTLQLKAGRVNHEIDTIKWGEIVAMGIIKYFNPEYISAGKKEKEPLRKKPQDKTYYDRTFNNNATSNSSILFKKK